MHIGVSLPTPADPSAIVAEAEERGFHSAWLYDSQMLYADLFMGMALAAKATRRIRIASGVLVPSNRIAPTTATCLATLNQLAPGRIDFGIGTGYTARRTMGQSAVSMKRMAEYIRVIVGLLNNETVEWESEGRSHKIRYLNPEVGMINLDDPIRLHISALGPKGRSLTAENDAAWLTAYSGIDQLQGEMSAMRQAWAAFGKNPDQEYSTCFSWGCVLDPGEPADSPRAKAQAGNFVAAIIHNFLEIEQHGHLGVASLEGPMGEAVAKYRKLYDSYAPSDAKYLALHRGHCMFVRDDEEPIISADLMHMLTIVGTEDEVVQRVRDLQALGFNQVTLQMTPGQERDSMDRWGRVAEQVGGLDKAAA